MDNMEDVVEETIEHKITKVNGEVGYKRYTKGKLLGKGSIRLIQAVSPSATKEST